MNHSPSGAASDSIVYPVSSCSPRAWWFRARASAGSERPSGGRTGAGQHRAARGELLTPILQIVIRSYSLGEPNWLPDLSGEEAIVAEKSWGSTAPPGEFRPYIPASENP